MSGGDVRRTLWPRFVLLAVILLAVGLAASSATQKSATMDEQNHIARGAAYLGTGDPRLSVEHPPLVNLLSALPVHVLLSPNLPLDEWWEVAEWYHFAESFLWRVNDDPQRIVALARLPIVGLGAVLISLVFRWASERFGATGGLLAASFLAFDPSVLAHMRLSTTDLGGALFMFLAAYTTWRLVQRPSRRRLLFAGIAVGLALGAKLSSLLFLPLLAGAVGLDALIQPGQRWRRLVQRWMLFAVSALAGLLILWALYGFQIGPVAELGVGMPASPFVRGVLSILDFSAEGRPAYLLGEYRRGGWWTYFPVAFAVKTPLVTLAAVLLATGCLLRRPAQQDVLLLTPPALYFLASMMSSLNIGYRHLLPVLPFLAVHVGRLAPSVARRSRRFAEHGGWRDHALALLPLALTLVLAVNAVAIYPHFLPYFNWIGGGPDNGWRVLSDSNIDWGQDLKGLQAWMAEEDVAQVRLAWFGSADPVAYGVDWQMLPGLPRGFLLWSDPPFTPQAPEPGTYVISVANLVGAHFPDHDLYAWFRARTPDAKIGYSLFIYRVGE